jgi:hypothetical protein
MGSILMVALYLFLVFSQLSEYYCFTVCESSGFSTTFNFSSYYANKDREEGKEASREKTGTYFMKVKTKVLCKKYDYLFKLFIYITQVVQSSDEDEKAPQKKQRLTKNMEYRKPVFSSEDEDEGEEVHLQPAYIAANAIYIIKFIFIYIHISIYIYICIYIYNIAIV